MTDFDSLREDIAAALEAITNHATAQNRLFDAQAKNQAMLWEDNAELRDELHALANRLENLTRAVTPAPAEVAERMVRHADGTMTCPVCDGSGALNVVQGDEIAQVQCERCEGFGRVRVQVRHA